MSVSLVRGHIVASRFRFIEQHPGSAGVGSVLEQLPAEDRARLARVGRDDWYPFQLVLRLDRAIAQLFSPGDPAIFEQIGEVSAQAWADDLGAERALLSVHTFLSRCAERHREAHSFGGGRYDRLGFSEGELMFHDYPEVDEIWCRSMCGFLRGAIQILAEGPATVEERGCQCRGHIACVFHAHWEGRHRPDPA